jgi:cytochrome c oxidase cbb3-type subunit IV
MDINVLRGVLTALCFAAFILIVLWAWSGRQRARFAEAARLPLAEDASEEDAG